MKIVPIIQYINSITIVCGTNQLRIICAGHFAGVGEGSIFLEKHER